MSLIIRVEEKANDQQIGTSLNKQSSKRMEAQKNSWSFTLITMCIFGSFLVFCLLSMEATKKELIDSKATEAKAKADLTSMQLKLEIATEKLINRQTENEKLQENLSALKPEIANLNIRLEEKQIIVSKLRNYIAEVERQCNWLEENIKSLERTNISLKEKLAQVAAHDLKLAFDSVRQENLIKTLRQELDFAQLTKLEKDEVNSHRNLSFSPDDGGETEKATLLTPWYLQFSAVQFFCLSVAFFSVVVLLLTLIGMGFKEKLRMRKSRQL